MNSRKPLISLLLIVGSLWSSPAASLGDMLQDQPRLTSVGLLGFLDDSGQGAPPEFCRRITQEVRRKIALAYKDLVPRSLTTDTGSLNAMTVDQLVSAGKQNGVAYVVRGGLLTVSTGNQTILVELYADVVSVESGQVASTRSEGTAHQSGTASGIDWSAASQSGGAAQSGPLDQALAMAVEKLAAAIHQVITAPTTAMAIAPQPAEAADVSAEPQESPEAAASDDELRQMVAQAESLIAEESVGNRESLDALRQALANLKAALEAKAGLMEQAADTSQADQDIAARKQELQTALSAMTEQAASIGSGATDSMPPAPEKRNLLAKINEYSTDALSILQKIQEMRAMFRSSKEEEQALSQLGDTVVPVEEPAGDLSGVITEDGAPIEGATVTESVSGLSAMTEKDGSYNLTGLIEGRLAKLVVTKAGKQVGSGGIDIPRGRQAVADFDLKPAASTRTPLRIAPSTVVLKNPGTGNTGVVKGVIRDPQGKPVPLALVNIGRIGVARTDLSGRYVFLNVPAGNHPLSVRKTGLNVRTQQVQVAARTSSDAPVQFSSRDVAANGVRREALLVGSEGATVRGIVRDEQNHPVPGVKLVAMASSAAVSVLAGKDGSYEFRNLKPGQYRLVATRAGHESSVRSLVVRPGEPSTQNFVIKKSADPLARLVERRRPDTQRSAAVPLRTGTGQLAGRIVDAESRRPVPGATISVPGHLSARSDANGNYSVNSLQAGRHRVSIRKQGFSELHRIVVVHSGEVTRQELQLSKDGQSENVPPRIQPAPQARMQPGAPARTGRVRGQVVDARSGRPVAGAIVLLSTRQSVTTGPDGVFLFGDLPPGTYRVVVRRAGYTDISGMLTVRAGETVSHALRLAPVPAGVRR